MREARVRLSASLSSFHPSSVNNNGQLGTPSSLPTQSGVHTTTPTISSQRSMSVIALGTSPKDIQSHLYQSFLEGRTADVLLHVRGSWEGFYKLHRVVLIQALVKGFFRSLFDGGFRESSHKDVVDVNFDDTNITRAAFEICISRLYGGGPPLHVDPRLVPTRNVPLTDSFPNPKPSVPTPPGHHPATPRFLLSLLATAIYLSIPTIASQALQLILSSLGPQTVLPYLNFAIGKGLPEKQHDELEAAVGLGHVCNAVKAESVPTVNKDSLPENGKIDTVLSPLLENFHIIQKEGPVDGKDSDQSGSDFEDEDDFGACYCYGPVSDKIGEAAACWLTRWGMDVLPYEEEIVEGTEAQKRQAVHDQGDVSNCDIPFLWRRGGLNAKWVRAIVSSDAFFCPSERDRYNFACRITELRRKEGIDKSEEKEWEELFSHGIYYMHMSLEDIIDISRHLSPTTNEPFTSLRTLQSAHWDQALLRQSITYRPRSSSGSPPQSPVQSGSKDGELGISLTTAELLASLEPGLGKQEEEKRYYPVPADSSLRIGDWDTSGSESRTMEQLFTARTQMTRTGSGRRLQTLARTSEANFFGILNEWRTASECIESDPTGSARWSPFPPYRFGVEFWGVEQSSSRMYSQTVWYAGNLFNVYAQVVKKKGQQQLGVYLHRQSTVDPIPPPSSPPLNMVERPRVQSHGRNTSVPTASPSQVSIPVSVSMHSLIPRPASRSTIATGLTGHIGQSRSTTPTSTSSSPSPQRSSHVIIHAPSQPYRDPRQAITAYFTIYCASPTGSSLTRFSSAPDVFTVSQSWGWKSSSLHLQQEDPAGSNGETPAFGYGKEVSVRATGVLGVV